MTTMYAKAAGGAWSSAATWSATGSGGVDSAGPPTAATDVVLESGSGNVTIDAGAVCRSLDATSGTGTYAGTLTHTAGVTLVIGDGTAGANSRAFKLTAGMTYTLGDVVTSALSFISTSATQQSFTTAGKATGSWTINAVGGSYILGDAKSTQGNITLTQGTLDTGNFNCSCGQWIANGILTRTLSLGSSTITILSGSGWTTNTITGLTMTANTATIVCSGANTTFNSGALNFNGTSLSFTGGGVAFCAGTGYTLKDFSFAGTAIKTCEVEWLGNLTFTGNLTVSGQSAINRTWINSTVIGTVRTITVGGTVTLTNVDIQDMTATGAAGTWTGTSMGDCGGNTNITFDTPATQTHTASAGGNWSDVTKWTSRVPLPQDSVVVNASTTGTLTADMPRLGGSITFTGFTGTFDNSTVDSVYGDLTMASGMTTAAASGSTMSLKGRGSRTITTAGHSLGFPVSVATAPTSTYTLGDAYASSNTFNCKNGAFNTGNFNMSILSFIINNASGVTLTLGSSVISLNTTSGTPFSGSGANTTINAGTSEIIIATASSSSRTFAAGTGANNKTFYKLTYTVAGSTGALILTGSGTYNTINFSDATNARTLTLTSSTTTTVTNFNVNGSAGKLVTIDAVTPGTKANLVKAGTGIVNCDYLSIKDNGATPADTWYAGMNSTSVSNVTGWTFNVGVIDTEAGSGAEAQQVTALDSETAAGTDTQTAQAATETAAETAAGTESQTVTVVASPGSDTGTGTEAGTTTVSVSSADTGAFTEDAVIGINEFGAPEGIGLGIPHDLPMDLSPDMTGTYIHGESITVTEGSSLYKDESNIQEAAEVTETESLKVVFDSRPTHGVATRPLNRPQTNISFGDWKAGGKDRQFRAIYSQSLTLNLFDPSTVAFNVRGEAPEAKLFHAGISDCVWTRKGVDLFRGRIFTAEDNIDEDKCDIAVTCMDYRGYLDRRNIEADINYGGDLWTINGIVWDAIDTIQKQVGGDIGIKKGLWPNNGQKLDLAQFKDGDSAWKIIKQLSTMKNGFDLEITPELVANLHYPMMGGNYNGAVLDYGGTIAKATRREDMSSYANAIRESGNQPSLPHTIVDSDIGSRPEGRWDLSFSDTTLLNQESVIEAGKTNFANSSVLLPTYTLTYKPGRWGGPEDLWIGDMARVIIKRGRLDVDDYFRVVSIGITLDENNEETVNVTCGRPKKNPFRYISDTLKNLSKR